MISEITKRYKWQFRTIGYDEIEAEFLADYATSRSDISWFEQEQLDGNFESGTSISEFLKKLIHFGFYVIYLMIGFFRLKSKNNLDKFIFSLTRNQVVSTSDVKEFLKNKKITSINMGEVLIEIRPDNIVSFLRSLIRDTFTASEIVLDIPVAIYFRQFNTAVKIKTLKRILIRLFIALLSSKYESIKHVKKLIIDRCILEEFYLQKGTSKKIELITTQSSLRVLPSAFYIIGDVSETKMVWYSNNSEVVRSRLDTRTFDETRYVRTRISTHYVWTEEWAEKLRRIYNIENVNVIASGSLMFYLKSQFHETNTSKLVTIFDVSPLKQFNDKHNFYAEENVLKFLTDLREVSMKFENLFFVLKIKRGSNVSQFTNRYTQCLSELEKLNHWKIIRDEVNLYDLISDSSFVIGIPYVSPLVIANELSIPNCYFFTNNNLWIFPQQRYDSPIISMKEDLVDQLGLV